MKQLYNVQMCNIFKITIQCNDLQQIDIYFGGKTHAFKIFI